MRVVSLLPGATEFLLLIEQEEGLIPQTVSGDTPPDEYEYNGLLVGRSHECDYPNYITNLPVLTIPRVDAQDCQAIHNQVTAALVAKEPLYTVDVDRLVSLRPDLILTQDVCDVCAVDVQTIGRIAASLNPSPTVLNLTPRSFDEVLAAAGQ